ncbi:acylphosphatase [Thermophilibacter provencensis]|uniref:acylphosphatase n=1 Tax=Thermophilibacter provencensis TaxID=1852386 RepID=A0ABT7V2X6_9ACTN|nr:acylphosphatase [Thermophilibacter provencensis]MDM8270351.1 acylphosphatase [Thermophilibacter provencensis]
MFTFWHKESESVPEEEPQLPADTKRLRLRFVGEVQGVGFRWTASLVAKNLELTGWVKNELDGSVTAEIQGSESHVGAFFSQMLEQYRRHPIHYVVSEREDIEPLVDDKRFEVRY